jgi:hypothetical protein
MDGGNKREDSTDGPPLNIGEGQKVILCENLGVTGDWLAGRIPEPMACSQIGMKTEAIISRATFS